MLPFAIIAWAGHTEASRAFAINLVEALRKHGVKHETFAADMGLSDKSVFSRQLAGKEPMNAFRLETALMKHPRMALTLARLQARRLRAEVISEEDLAFVRGAFALGKKKMARILPAIGHERKAS